MSLALSRKVEKAITGWLPSVLSITGMNYYEGHEKAADVEFPALIVYAEGSSVHAEMPPGTGVRDVKLRCKFVIDSDATTRANADTWKQKLETAMVDDIAALQSALNKPITGADTRTVKQIHFHYIEMMDDPSEREETDWIEDLTFSVTVEPLDA